ncbi:MAG: hypothetical protein PW788_07825 [Micavibrio sp.]|nr:hypothetical protein [Micavibrio sp.]
MSKRPLTAGEIALARAVFGDSVDYAAVRLHNRRILPPLMQHKHQAVANGNNISFPRSSYSEDFATEHDALKQSVFIHEMTHVWQHQNKVVSTPKEALKETLRHKFNYSKAYPYQLGGGRDLIDYGFEQQAALVQDYFLLTRHNTAASFKHRRQDTRTPQDLTALKRDYETVLARFLKNPAYARGGRKCFKPPQP